MGSNERGVGRNGVPSLSRIGLDYQSGLVLIFGDTVVMATPVLLVAVLGAICPPFAGAATLVEPWGPNSVRIRTTTADGTAINKELPTALLPQPCSPRAGAETSSDTAGPNAVDSGIASGNIVVEPVPGQPGLRQFRRASDKKLLLEEISITVDSAGMATGAGGVRFKARIPAARNL